MKKCTIDYLGRLAFQAVEQGLCWATDAGKEIVLMASKEGEI